VIRVRVEIMGSQKCGTIGKSQSVLRISPIVFTRTRIAGAGGVERERERERVRGGRKKGEGASVSPDLVLPALRHVVLDGGGGMQGDFCHCIGLRPTHIGAPSALHLPPHDVVASEGWADWGTPCQHRVRMWPRTH
jgi:hypothetical protein